MAIAEVGAGSQRATSGSNGGANSDALAFPGNVTAGSLLVVGGAAWGSTLPTGVGVTDTRSTPYTVVLGTNVTGLTWRTFIAYGIAPSSGACTVTVNPSASANDFSFSIDEFSGCDATPADVDGGTTALKEGAGTVIADSITTVAADALIVGVTSNESGTTITPDSPLVQIAENESNSGNQCHNFAYRIVTTATAYSISWTLGLSLVDRTAQTHSFKPDTGGAAPASLIWMPRPMAALIGR